MFGLETLVEPFVEAHLERFIANYRAAKERFTAGLFEFRDIVLNHKSVNEVVPNSLPLELLGGRIQHLRIEIPWSSLQSKPIEVTIAGLDLHCRLQKKPSNAQSSFSDATPEMDGIDQEEDEGDSLAGDLLPSFIDTFIKTAAANLKLTCTRVNFLVALGDRSLSLSLSELSMYSQGNAGNPFFVETSENLFVNKLVALRGLSARLDSDRDSFSILEPSSVQLAIQGEILQPSSFNIDILTGSLELALCADLFEMVPSLLEVFKTESLSPVPPSPKGQRQVATHAKSEEPLSWVSWTLNLFGDTDDSDKELDRLPEPPAASVPTFTVGFRAPLVSIRVLGGNFDSKLSFRGLRAGVRLLGDVLSESSLAIASVTLVNRDQELFRFARIEREISFEPSFVSIEFYQSQENLEQTMPFDFVDTDFLFVSLRSEATSVGSTVIAQTIEASALAFSLWYEPSFIDSLANMFRPLAELPHKSGNRNPNPSSEGSSTTILRVRLPGFTVISKCGDVEFSISAALSIAPDLHFSGPDKSFPTFLTHSLELENFEVFRVADGGTKDPIILLNHSAQTGLPSLSVRIGRALNQHSSEASLLEISLPSLRFNVSESSLTELVHSILPSSPISLLAEPTFELTLSSFQFISKSKITHGKVTETLLVSLEDVELKSGQDLLLSSAMKAIRSAEGLCLSGRTKPQRLAVLSYTGGLSPALDADFDSLVFKLSPNLVKFLRHMVDLVDQLSPLSKASPLRYSKFDPHAALHSQNALSSFFNDTVNQLVSTTFNLRICPSIVLVSGDSNNALVMLLPSIQSSKGPIEIRGLEVCVASRIDEPWNLKECVRPIDLDVLLAPGSVGGSSIKISLPSAVEVLLAEDLVSIVRHILLVSGPSRQRPHDATPRQPSAISPQFSSRAGRPSLGSASLAVTLPGVRLVFGSRLAQMNILLGTISFDMSTTSNSFSLQLSARELVVSLGSDTLLELTSSRRFHLAALSLSWTTKFSSSFLSFEENRIAILVQPVNITLPAGSIQKLIKATSIFDFPSPSRVFRKPVLQSRRLSPWYEGAIAALSAPDIIMTFHGLRLGLIRVDPLSGKIQLTLNLDEVSAILEKEDLSRASAKLHLKSFSALSITPTASHELIKPFSSHLIIITAHSSENLRVDGTLQIDPLVASFRNWDIAELIHHLPPPSKAPRPPSVSDEYSAYCNAIEHSKIVAVPFPISLQLDFAAVVPILRCSFSPSSSLSIDAAFQAISLQANSDSNQSSVSLRVETLVLETRKDDLVKKILSSEHLLDIKQSFEGPSFTGVSFASIRIAPIDVSLDDSLCDFLLAFSSLPTQSSIPPANIELVPISQRHEPILLQDKVLDQEELARFLFEALEADLERPRGIVSRISFNIGQFSLTVGHRELKSRLIFVISPERIELESYDDLSSILKASVTSNLTFDDTSSSILLLENFRVASRARLSSDYLAPFLDIEVRFSPIIANISPPSASSLLRLLFAFEVPPRSPSAVATEPSTSFPKSSHSLLVSFQNDFASLRVVEPASDMALSNVGSVSVRSVEDRTFELHWTYRRERKVSSITFESVSIRVLNLCSFDWVRGVPIPLPTAEGDEAEVLVSCPSPSRSFSLIVALDSNELAAVDPLELLSLVRVSSTLFWQGSSSTQIDLKMPLAQVRFFTESQSHKSHLASATLSNAGGRVAIRGHTGLEASAALTASLKVLDSTRLRVRELAQLALAIEFEATSVSESARLTAPRVTLHSDLPLLRTALTLARAFVDESPRSTSLKEVLETPFIGPSLAAVRILNMTSVTLHFALGDGIPRSLPPHSDTSLAASFLTPRASLDILLGLEPTQLTRCEIQSSSSTSLRVRLVSRDHSFIAILERVLEAGQNILRIEGSLRLLNPLSSHFAVSLSTPTRRMETSLAAASERHIILEAGELDSSVSVRLEDDSGVGLETPLVLDLNAIRVAHLGASTVAVASWSDSVQRQIILAPLLKIVNRSFTDLCVSDGSQSTAINRDATALYPIAVRQLSYSLRARDFDLPFDFTFDPSLRTLSTQEHPSSPPFKVELRELPLAEIAKGSPCFEVVVTSPLLFRNLTSFPIRLKKETDSVSTLVEPGGARPLPSSAGTPYSLGIGDIDSGSWTLPFSVEKPMDTTVTLKQSRGLYLRFNLVLQEESLSQTRVQILTLRPKFVVINRTSSPLILAFSVDEKALTEASLPSQSSADLSSFRLRNSSEFHTRVVLVEESPSAPFVKGNEIKKSVCSAAWELAKPTRHVFLSLPLRAQPSRGGEEVQAENRLFSLVVLEFESAFYSIISDPNEAPLQIENRLPFPMLLSTSSQIELRSARILMPGSFLSWSWADDSNDALSLTSLCARSRSLRFGSVDGSSWTPSIDLRSVGENVLFLSKPSPPGTEKLASPRRGDDQVSLRLVVSGQGYNRKLVLLPSDSSFRLFGPRVLRSQKEFSIAVTINELSVSIISDCEEKALLSLQGLRLASRRTFPSEPFKSQEPKFSVDLSVKKLQLDNFLATAEFEVACNSGYEKAQAISISLGIQLTSADLVEVSSLDAAFAPITVHLDQSLIDLMKQHITDLLALLPIVSPPPRSQSLLLERIHVPESELPIEILKMIEGPRVVIGKLRVSTFQIVATVHADLGVFLGFSNTPIQLPALTLDDVDARVSDFTRALISEHSSALISSSPMLLGSFEALGNPAMLTHAVVNGLSDLVLLPVRRGRDGGWAGFVRGLGSGSASLFKNLTQGTLFSMVGVSSGFARNFQRLSFDQQYYNAKQRDAQLAPATFREGLSNGARGFASGLWDGVSGVVMTPLRRAQSKGLSSLPTGIGQGLIGIIAKPVGGALEFVSQTSQGLLSQTGLSHSSKRLRQPRVVAERRPLILFQIRLWNSSPVSETQRWLPVRVDPRLENFPEITLIARSPSQTAFFLEDATLIGIVYNSHATLDGSRLRCLFDGVSFSLCPQAPFEFIW